MAQSPLVEAVAHFSLAQLIADPNLLRNVLNDIGAPPSEAFLITAALDARIPQTLIEHSSTNDLAVVEPRLVTALTERGIERSRAEWAVNAWKEVVGGSTLGQPTIRPSEPATVRPSQPAPVVSGEPLTVRPNQPAGGSPAQAPPPPASPPVSRPGTVPMPPDDRRGRRRGIIIAAVVAALLVVGLVVWLVRPSSKHNTASSTSSGASSQGASSPGSTPSSPASSTPAGSAPPTGNLNAPLGAAKGITVPGTAAWTDTGLKVTAGERINVTASGQIAAGTGSNNGPDGINRTDLDVFTLVGGGHVGGLIGLVAGSGAPFLVGSNYNGLATTAGELYLGINDTGVDNNSGQFSAIVRLQS
jgi:hypothetical protein